jgi:hypothetical protein
MGWLGQPDEPKPEPLPPPPEKWWKKPAKLYTKWRNKMSETKNGPVYEGVDITMLAEQPDALISHELSAPLRNVGASTQPQQEQQELKRKGPKPGYMQAKIAAEAQRLLAEHQANGFGAVISGNMQQPQQRPEQNIFLIDGTVNFVPLRPNIQPVTAQQTRIVWANNTDEAMNKYRSYFSSLNTAEAMYVVVGMVVSEAIV